MGKYHYAISHEKLREEIELMRELYFKALERGNEVQAVKWLRYFTGYSKALREAQINNDYIYIEGKY